MNQAPWLKRIGEQPRSAQTRMMASRTCSMLGPGSAVITAEQYRAAAAVMLVHSFSPERTGWADYAAFLELFGVEAQEGTLQRLSGESPVPLFVAWAVGNAHFLEA